MHEAKTTLSKLLARVEAGEEVTISRGGRPVARLVAVEPRGHAREPGAWKGRVQLSEDFDAPLPEAQMRAWRGTDA